jgi:glycosyltransferase involved in cell wall biosynthesis
VVTPNTIDMRPVYGRARLLLAPSLWWESGGRVAAEAMLNGIPAIITDHGGMPEMVRGAGVVLKLNSIYHEKPYALVPGDEALLPLLERLIQLYDDEVFYAEMVARAQRVGQTQHHVLASTGRLLRALQPWVDIRAGDRDAGATLRHWHKHGLDDRPLVSRIGASESMQ